ncbi:phasin family protein [Castellaniella caeni]
MEDLHQQVRDGQKALLAHVHQVQFLFLDGFEKWVSLNLQAVRSRLDDASGQAGAAKHEANPLARLTHRWQHQLDRTLAYGHQLGEIIEGVQSGLRELSLSELERFQHPAVGTPAASVKAPVKVSVTPTKVPAVPTKASAKAAPTASGKPSAKATPVASKSKPTSAKAASAVSRRTAAKTAPGKSPAKAISPAAKASGSAAGVLAAAPSAPVPAVGKPVAQAPVSAQATPPVRASVPSAATRASTLAVQAPAPAPVAASAPVSAADSASVESQPVNVIGHLVAQTTPAAVGAKAAPVPADTKASRS